MERFYFAYAKLFRKDIRRDEIYFRLHNFLVAETGKLLGAFCGTAAIFLPRSFMNDIFSTKVSIRKTFARNFCGTKRNIFLSLRINIARKKQQFAQSFAKVISRKIALFRFCETQVLRKSAIS